MNNTVITEQLRKLVREEIDSILAETLTSSNIGSKAGVETHTLSQDDKKVGYVKTKGKSIVGRIGPKAATKPLDEAEESTPKPSKKKKKGEKSQEDKARDIGQKEMFDEGMNTVDIENNYAQHDAPNDPHGPYNDGEGEGLPKGDRLRTVKDPNAKPFPVKTNGMAARLRQAHPPVVSELSPEVIRRAAEKQVGKAMSPQSTDPYVLIRQALDKFKAAHAKEAPVSESPKQTYTMNEMLEMLKKGELK